MLPEWIKVIEESNNPLSCRCFVVEGEKSTWIFDVGAGDAAAEYINSIDGEKNVILSHFHPDHVANLERIQADRVFQTRYTQKHTNIGEAMEEKEIRFEDGRNFRVFQLPNSHSKGSLALETGDFAFLGDAIFPTHKEGHHCYNASQLHDQIQALQACDVKYFVLSHNPEFVYEKEDMLKRLKRVFRMRRVNEPYIYLD